MDYKYYELLDSGEEQELLNNEDDVHPSNLQGFDGPLGGFCKERVSPSGGVFREEEEDADDDDQSLCIEKSRLLANNEKIYHERLTEDEDVSPPFPLKVFYIIGSEFCERFSFYGLRAVLVLYMSNVLLLSEDSATSFFHGWTFLCYFTSVLGAFLADSILGKYRTIFYLSVVYLLGNIVLSISSISPIVPGIVGKLTVSSIGLILIAFGTGGIKPCVSAFGGDQFELPQQEKQLSRFFSVFYFSINAGSLLSTFLTPILREDVTCFGGQCFPLAFGVPAILMFFALVSFVVGTPLYKIIPPEGNIGCEVIKCVMYAVWRKIKLTISKIGSALSKSSSGNSKPISVTKAPHWLDLSEGKFPKTLIEDIKCLLAVLTLYIPLPLFWALFDQQASRWTFQATKLSGSMGSWTIKPDQMQVLNPLLILLLIPFFQSVVYPLGSKFGFLKNLLHRITIGGLLAGVAFVVSGLLQIAIENSSSHVVPEGKISLVLLNNLPCSLEVELSPVRDSIETKFLPPHELILDVYNKEDFINSSHPEPNVRVLIKASISSTSSKCSAFSNINSTLYLEDFNTKEVFLIFNSYMGDISLVQIQENSFPQNGSPHLRVIDSTDFLRFSPILLRSEEETIEIKSENFSRGISYSEMEFIHDGRFDVILPAVSHSGNGKSKTLGSFSASPFTVILLFDSPLQNSSSTQMLKSEKRMKVFHVSVPSLHMLWLLPQYILISTGEIMFSITGLEFSFTQAPASMKSVIQAAWLLTTAFGDLLVVIVAKSKLFSKQSSEFFLFAALMVVDMIVFYFLSRNYENNLTKKKSEKKEAEESAEGTEPSSCSSHEELCSSDPDKHKPNGNRYSTFRDGDQMGSSL